ncbi:Chaperone protein DnaJ 2 [Babesia sp. Xinjiang]|uniref:Chaperone protein DnaJ 2 n=1 Tax=Babesia sp. Xinjiang TaxID=462227 RepID=UPI000A21C9BF|nr:Chaperone protein DnaJ 2 [Babesia sp. Xinjiang]ORM41122.1 Chaperone protein DnaJ 2 [Babesia sp. Xinjiang]
MDNEPSDFDYYDILNVTRDSSVEEIKASYHKLIRQWHPDKNLMPFSEQPEPQSPSYRNAESFDVPQELQRDSAFNKIQLAYSVLSDPDQRRVYDNYGSEGVMLKKVLRQQLDQERVEWDAIPESIEDEDTVRKSLELRKAADEIEIERRINFILQQRRLDKFRELPVQVISQFTFSGVTHFFDDEIANFVRRRLFQIRDTSILNSLEVRLSKRTRLGYSYNSSVARGTFGKSRSGVYLSSELTDSVESTVSVDWGEYMSYRYGWLSLKKKFSDHFWASSVFGLNRQLTPMMRCVVHKSWGDNHAVEITALPDYVLTYGYNRVLPHDLKLNLQAALSPDDVGTLLRVKALSNTGAVVGTRCRYSMLGGLYLEGYIRQKFYSELLAKVKFECRLRYDHNAIFIIFKLVLNNTRFDLPIELYRGNTDRCVFLGTTAACSLLLLPAMWDMAVKFLSPEEKKIQYGSERQTLRSSFYSQFPTFSYLGLVNDYSKRHERYVSEQTKSIALLDRSSQWSEDALEAIVTRELRFARQEGLALFNAAKSCYQREDESDGLCILFAVYGHPESLNTLSKFVTMDLFDDLSGIVDRSDPVSPISSTGRRFVFGAVTVESLLRQNDQLRLQRLFERYVLDVTNVLMSRVTDSRLTLSIGGKGQLIGFADPCSNLVNIESELFVCYRYKRKTYAIRFRDADPVLLPEGCSM